MAYRLLSFIAGAGLIAAPAIPAELNRHDISIICNYLRGEGWPDVDPSTGGEDRFLAGRLPGRGMFAVYARGPNICGTGGCVLSILRRNGTKIEEIETDEVILLPVTLLPTRHHGRPDLGLWTHASPRYGSNLFNYQTTAEFDGDGYHVTGRNIGENWWRPVGTPLIWDGMPEYRIYPRKKSEAYH